MPARASSISFSCRRTPRHSPALVRDIPQQRLIHAPAGRRFAAGADMRDTWRQAKIGWIEKRLHVPRAWKPNPHDAAPA